MSETQDPRVLAPSEDEPDVIVKAAFGGNGNAYHTEECMSVQSMRNTKTVKLSVAEWKGYHECHFCKADRNAPDREQQNSTGEQRTDMPTLEECETFRTKIGRGESLAQVASESEWGRTAVSTHAQGNCQHETSVRPVANGWYFDPEREDSPGVRAKQDDDVSEKDCQNLRLALVKGANLRGVGDEYGLSKNTIQYHALGRCAHEPRIDAVSYGWHFE